MSVLPISYFQIQDGHFTHDQKLGFDYLKVLNYPKKFIWDRWIPSANWTKEPDLPIDISQIPPSIFLLAIVNSLSSGFSLFIPLDLTYSCFFEKLVDQFSLGFSSDELSPGIISSSYLNSRFVDLEYLNATGKIRSPLQWNRGLSNNDCLPIYQGSALRSIQGIVLAAQEFWDCISKN